MPPRSSLTDIMLRAGTSDKERGGSLHPPENIISHPNFRTEPNMFDIAVIKVSIHDPSDNTKSAVCLTWP